MTNATFEVQTRVGASPTYDFILSQPFHYDTYLTYEIVY